MEGKGGGGGRGEFDHQPEFPLCGAAQCFGSWWHKYWQAENLIIYPTGSVVYAGGRDVSKSLVTILTFPDLLSLASLPILRPSRAVVVMQALLPLLRCVRQTGEGRTHLSPMAPVLYSCCLGVRVGPAAPEWRNKTGLVQELRNLWGACTGSGIFHSACDISGRARSPWTAIYNKQCLINSEEPFLPYSSKPLPRVEGKHNVTMLDTQIQKLRLKSLQQIQEAAARLRNEAAKMTVILTEVEDWLDRLIQLTEEVSSLSFFAATWLKLSVSLNGVLPLGEPPPQTTRGCYTW